MRNTLKSTHFKNTATEVSDVDMSKRTIVAYVSKFGNVDLDGDMMMQGCYKKSIMERGKNGTDELFHLSNHRRQPEYVLSKPIFEEDIYGLKMTSTIANTTHGNDVLELYNSGAINQHSVMFSVPSGQYRVVEMPNNQSYTEIQQCKFYEGSTVLWGANPDTPTLEIKNYFKDIYQEDITKAFGQLKKLTKAFKTGKFSDEFFPLLEIEIKLLETIIEENFQPKSIESVADTTQPPTIAEVNFNDFFKQLQKI
jgi:uncharacterized protein